MALIERRFKHLAGLETFSADVVAGRLRVQYDAARLSTGAIVGAVADTGMRAWLEHEEPRGTQHDRSACRWMLAASGASLAVSLAAHAAGVTTSRAAGCAVDHRLRRRAVSPPRVERACACAPSTCTC